MSPLSYLEPVSKEGMLGTLNRCKMVNPKTKSGSLSVAAPTMVTSDILMPNSSGLFKTMSSRLFLSCPHPFPLTFLSDCPTGSLSSAHLLNTDGPQSSVHVTMHLLGPHPKESDSGHPGGGGGNLLSLLKTPLLIPM